MRASTAIHAVHRPLTASRGKPAAIRTRWRAERPCRYLFDADYLPDPPLLKKLVAPFTIPKSRDHGPVVPYNTNTIC